MKIPCEECITFALCKQKNPLRCKLLYAYLYCDWEHLTHVGHNRRMNQVRRTFNRNGFYTYSVANGEELNIEWL